MLAWFASLRSKAIWILNAATQGRPSRNRANLGLSGETPLAFSLRVRLACAPACPCRRSVFLGPLIRCTSGTLDISLLPMVRRRQRRGAQSDGEIIEFVQRRILVVAGRIKHAVN